MNDTENKQSEGNQIQSGDDHSGINNTSKERESSTSAAPTQVLDKEVEGQTLREELDATGLGEAGK
ncbi:hypothetical protein SARC_12797 [Sphaeroforma arctica JP610]|uniref:Uncharacterized protein n=1 Tax=Sphaeroforma arctica JP610 TaxID=667725 RepID=A0A0L0FD47_9EUKA|nr:hypothetical protein SARC_12797 [Sphaeroforma arctica JP610]KNC74665.1 hypothetical protein SARC_12797 [Sphaeroforma arctica JP610]|eukprot:XP_014148567.1 hypothetical protein SARC_12797 [Sphaeroforma arctica JP610]